MLQEKMREIVEEIDAVPGEFKVVQWMASQVS